MPHDDGCEVLKSLRYVIPAEAFTPMVVITADTGAETRKQALSAADRLRDKYGESAVHIGSALKAKIRERTHDNPVGLPGRAKPGSDKQ